MHILFITPYVPSRIRVRPFQLIKHLSGTHEVSLIALVCDGYERSLAADVTPYCATLDLVPLSPLQAYGNCVRALPTLTPLRVAYYQSPALVQRITEVVRQRRTDVIHGELIKVAPALRAVVAASAVPVLYDSVDCISLYLRQQWSTARRPWHKAFLYSELQKVRRYEREALAAFDQVVITSARDRDALMDLRGRLHKIQVIPNGVDTHYFAPLASPRTSDALVFCAKLDYYPNAHAIRWFCQEVLPHIWQVRPQTRLTIVGSNPPGSVLRLSADQRITVTGYVPDVRPYLGMAAVALAPLRVAAGMQNKVLEALAMEAPLVATSPACHVLNAVPDVHLLVADDARDYAAAVLRLLEDPAQGRRLGHTGRQFVERHFSWSAAADSLTDLYHAMVAAQGSQVRALAPA
jgi:sugar transferase (PEP-CTERM/EpsH1 system associated)